MHVTSIENRLHVCDARTKLRLLVNTGSVVYFLPKSAVRKERQRQPLTTVTRWRSTIFFTHVQVKSHSFRVSETKVAIWQPCHSLFMQPTSLPSVHTEMNREITSAPEKSEVSFCARRTAVVSRPSMEPCAHFPDWSLKRAHGAGRGKREKTVRFNFSDLFKNNQPAGITYYLPPNRRNSSHTPTNLHLCRRKLF